MKVQLKDKKKIAIDNGHGLRTAGKRTPPFPSTSKVIHEWEFNHPTAKKLENIFKNQGHEVLMVSDTETDTSINTRVNRANQWGADVFISIHYNAFKGIWGTHGGIVTLYHSRSTPGKRLAEIVQKELISVTKLRNRGAKPRTNLGVLNRTKMVAILPECGFMDNLKEANLMLDEQYQAKCATAIAKGINDYFGVKFQMEPVQKRDPMIIDIPVTLKGKRITLKGIYRNHTNYIPLRTLEEFGIRVDWDSKTNEIKID